MQHVEYLDAVHTSVEWINEEEVYGAISPGDRMVLALGADDAVVITGTPQEIRNLIDRMQAAVSEASEGQ